MTHRKDQDFGLKRTIHSIFDGADFPDDVRQAIAQAKQEQRTAEPDCTLSSVPTPHPPQDREATINLMSPSALHPDAAPQAPKSSNPVVLPVVESQSSSSPTPETPERGRTSQSRDDAIVRLQKKLKCPKNFECCETGFTVLCKTRLALGGRVVECVGKDQKKCRFRRSVFGKGICGCRMRQYIARTLGL